MGRVSRRTARLTLDHLAEVAEPVRSCLFWELDPVDRARLDDDERDRGEGAGSPGCCASGARAAGWCSSTGGSSGTASTLPAAYLPGAAALPTAPASPDAVVLTTVWVEPGDARRRARPAAGAGRWRGTWSSAATRAVEAFGDTRGRADGCVMPAEFLGRVGFKTQRAHVTTPRMRMELRTA